MVIHPHLLAAVDLGSNSFRLIVGRVEETPAGSQIYQVDALGFGAASWNTFALILATL